MRSADSSRRPKGGRSSFPLILFPLSLSRFMDDRSRPSYSHHSHLLSHKWKQLELIEGWEKLSLPRHITNSPGLPPISSTMTKIFGIQWSRSLLSHILGPSYGCMPTHFCTIWVKRAQIFVLLHSTVFAVKHSPSGTLLPCYLLWTAVLLLQS